MAFGVAAAAASATSHIVDITWGGDGAFAHTAAVEPGKFVELCGKLEPGAQVAWRFESTVPLDFNIHYHVGKDTVFPARRAQVRSGDDVLRVAASEDHCWMWTNKTGERAALQVRLSRERR